MNEFSHISGPQLNIEKTKGIWLGPLKEFGLRKYCQITWTGNPVKCLGIYIGHNKEKCFNLNWTSKIISMKKLLQQWKQRSLTLKGKILIIKTLALSKIVFPATILTVPKDVVSDIKSCVFEFIWGKRDRIKRNVIINTEVNGGLNMTDIDCFISALQASWVTRILYNEGKWKSILLKYLGDLQLDINYILKMNFKSRKSFPTILRLPTFYQDIFLAFNKIKDIKSIELLNDHKMFEQPVFGNENFKHQNKCLYMKSWLKAGIFYTKDLVNDKGNIKSDNELYQLFKNKGNLLQEMFIVKNCVIKLIRTAKSSIAKFVKIKPVVTLVCDNKHYIINNQKSQFFYDKTKRLSTSRNRMEVKLSKELGFENHQDIWANIYNQKIVAMFDNKLAEFNFKLLHNIVPCGYILCKWEQSVDAKCEVCTVIENVKHMLFDCPRIYEIWESIATILKCNIKWKHLVCGFIGYSSDKIIFMNTIFTIVSYAIFKENSRSKYENLAYKDLNIRNAVKRNLMYYRQILHRCKESLWTDIMFESLINNL